LLCGCDGAGSAGFEGLRCRQRTQSLHGSFTGSRRPQLLCGRPWSSPPHLAQALGEDFAQGAWEWLAELGAPSALVAGAAIASFFELKDDLAPRPGQSKFERIAKKLVGLLLLSSFALTISCVFVGTITGTMLLSNADFNAVGRGINAVGLSALGVLHREMEFEYLFVRCFLFQGLLNWIGAISLYCFAEAATLHPPEGREVHEVSRCQLVMASGSALLTLLLMMLAFYNGHLS